MSLRGYVKKSKPAGWTLAFPGQLSPVKERVTKVSRQSASRKRKDPEYVKLARASLKGAIRLGMRCPVVACVPELREGVRYGWPISDKLAEIHHKRGRAGTLLTDVRWFMPVSKAGHRWIHAHPAEARALGWLCQPGEWNTPVPLDNFPSSENNNKTTSQSIL